MGYRPPPRPPAQGSTGSVRTAQVISALRTIGLDSKDFEALSMLLFLDPHDGVSNVALPMREFVKRVVRLAPDKNASVMDVGEMRHFFMLNVHSKLKAFELEFGPLVENHKRLSGRLGDIIRRWKDLELRLQNYQSMCY